MTTRVPPLPALLAVLVLTLVGCSDDDSGTTAPTETPSATATTTEAATPEAPPSESPTTGLGGTAAPSETSTPTPEPTATETPTPEPPVIGPATYDEAVALVAAASGSSELSRFFSPTGNLYCVLDSPFSPPACELARGAVPDATACPADGPSQSVGRIELAGGAPQPVCNSDTIREPGAPTLGYGGAATWPDTSVTCLMERIGVTCIDPSVGAGYFLARGVYRLL